MAAPRSKQFINGASGTLIWTSIINGSTEELRD
jgi:hypothetical protein